MSMSVGARPGWGQGEITLLGRMNAAGYFEVLENNRPRNPLFA